MSIAQNSTRPYVRKGVPLCLALILGAFTRPCALASSQTVSLNLHKILGGKEACAINNSVQFVSEDELLILAGPSSNCYQSVNDLELVIISTSGQVIARHSWPSTFPIVVLVPKSIVVANAHDISILDDKLQTIASTPLPANATGSSVFLSKEFPDTLVVNTPRGKSYKYRGDPLRLFAETSTPLRRLPSIIYSSEDGRTVEWKDRQLIATLPDGTSRVLSDLSWVIPCEKYCQEYEAGTVYSLATRGKKRVLFQSSGSRFPVTDAAGLFPYFRVSVFDLDSGAEVYRKQYITHTAKHTAQISPDGDSIALNNGDRILIERLN